MKKVRIDITGQYFGRLTVIKYVYTIKKVAYWLCKCECGKEKIVRGKDLKNGKIKSCGCFRKDECTTHDSTNTKLYKTYFNMKNRCENRSNPNYKLYGARGIKVCDEWKNDFLKFKEWAIINGYDENAQRGECTIDRIDVNGDYEPNNCRWVTNKVQQNNRRNNHLVTYNGQTRTLSEWAEVLKIEKGTLYTRFQRGWSVERALTQPMKNKKKKRGL